MPDYDPATGCVSVTTSLLHESGESITSTLRAPVAKTDPQGVGSAITYLRRYSLAAFVGVAPEDDDGEAAIQAPETEAPTGDSTVLANQSGIAQWPFGDRKGEPIRDFTVEELKAGREWCLKKNKKKFAALIQQIDQELDARDLEMV